MKTKPNIGDRVIFWNPICSADRVGTVIAMRDSDFGRTWEVALDEDGTEHIGGYVGTAEDRGGYCVPSQRAGIGAYLVEVKS
jgi:hypothetical protein